MSAPSSSTTVAEADADVQAVAQLVNRFAICTVQFLNRFAADCEAKLVRTDYALQQLELQTQLLEHMLLSTRAANGEDEEEEEEDASAAGDDGEKSEVESYGGSMSISHPEDEGSEDAMRHRRRRRRRSPLSEEENENERMGRLRLPPPPREDNSDGDDRPPPPPPGAARKGPLRPPPGIAHAAAEAAARAATLAIVGASIPLPSATSGALADGTAAPPPPPPLELRPGRLSMRLHPRLHGYFELLALRVPVDFVKAKMQADGHNEAWLDTPDAPAPTTLSTVVRDFADEPD